jgi:hypothetical protein
MIGAAWNVLDSVTSTDGRLEDSMCDGPTVGTSLERLDPGTSTDGNFDYLTYEWPHNWNFFGMPLKRSQHYPL